MNGSNRGSATCRRVDRARRRWGHRAALLAVTLLLACRVGAPAMAATGEDCFVLEKDAGRSDLAAKILEFGSPVILLAVEHNPKPIVVTALTMAGVGALIDLVNSLFPGPPPRFCRGEKHEPPIIWNGYDPAARRLAQGWYTRFDGLDKPRIAGMPRSAASIRVLDPPLQDFASLAHQLAAVDPHRLSSQFNGEPSLNPFAKLPSPTSKGNSAGRSTLNDFGLNPLVRVDPPRHSAVLGDYDRYLIQSHLGALKRDQIEGPWAALLNSQNSVRPQPSASIFTSIEGRILNQQSGAGIANATVELAGPSPGAVLTRAVLTSADGSYYFGFIIVGSYVLAARHDGYSSSNRTIEASAGKPTKNQDIMLTSSEYPCNFSITNQTVYVITTAYRELGISVPGPLLDPFGVSVISAVDRPRSLLAEAPGTGISWGPFAVRCGGANSVALAPH